MKKSLFLLMCLVGFACAWAQSTPFYTFKTAQSTSNTAYATLYDVTIDDMEWSVPGNQNFDGYIRIGGKSLDGVNREITAKNAMASAISKVVINHNGKSNANLVVNSVSVIASSNSSFTNIVDEKTIESPEIGFQTKGTFEFEHEWASDLYYKIVFNLTNPKTSNYGIDVTSIEFFASSVVDNRKEVTLTWSAETFTYTIGADNEAFPTLTKDPAALDGVKFASSDENVATIDAATGEITVVAPGKTYISAVFDGDNNYKSAVASYLLKVAAAQVPGHFNFVDWEFPGADDWTSGYAERVVKYDDAVITFDSANKQSSTITDCPVTKGQPVTLVITDKTKDISTFSAQFTQWGTKAQTITVYTSPDGNNFNETEITTDEFAFEVTALPAGVKAIKFVFSSQANQIGVANITITEAAASATPKIFADDEVDFGISFGTFEPKTLTVTAVNCTAPVTYTLDEENLFTIEGTLTAQGGTLTINCIATEVGPHVGVLTLKSEGAEDVEVHLAATIKEPAGTGSGTATDPYDVARAIDIITLGQNTEDNVYVKGTISKVEKYNSTYSSINYWLDDDAFEVYSGKGINGADFTSADDLTVGDEVVVCGVIKKYNTTFEMDKNNYIAAINYAESYPVKFTDKGMASFSATKAAVFEGDDVKAYIATRLENDIVYLERVTGVIAANTGLILMGSEGTADIELTDEAGTTPDNNLLKPWAPLSTVAESADGTNNYVLGQLDEDFGFFYLAKSITNNTGQGRAYLQTIGNALKQLKVRFKDGDTTKITEISADMLPGVIYNINGQRVNDNYKGIIIRDGKKIYNR